MERKRSSGSEEDSCESKKYRRKFTEVESIPTDDVRGKYFDEPLSDEYQPQFFNYQLIGDLVAVGILNSKDLLIKREYYVPIEPFTRRRFCNAAWSVHDLLNEMRSKKSCYPIASKVILSVGYNDYRLNLMNPHMFVECLEKTVKKLRRRGCKEIILTNVPPCGMECDSINHWKYLQIINEEILKFSEKHDYIGHCDIFTLFCRPKNLFSRNRDYVAGSEINYKVDFTMYDEVGPDDEIDLINFSNLAKIVLGKYVAKTVVKRVDYLRHPVDKIICILKEASDVDDSDSEVEVIEKTGDAVITLDFSDEDAAGGSRNNHTDMKKEVPQKAVPLVQESSSNFKKSDDIDEKTACNEISPKDERSVPVILYSIRSVDNVKVENPSSTRPPEDERLKPVYISGSIRDVGDIKVENPAYARPSEDERLQPVVTSGSIRGVGDVKVENPSSARPPEDERLKPVVISGSIGSGGIKVEQLSCEIPPENKPMKQVISCSIESVGGIKKKLPLCKLLRKDDRLEQVVLNSNTSLGDFFNKTIKQENASDIEKSEQKKPEVVQNIERSESVRHGTDMKNGTPSCNTPEKNAQVEQVILYNFKRPCPAVGQPSNGMPHEDYQMKPNISNSNNKSKDPKDEKPSCDVPKETPPFKPSCETPEKDAQVEQVILYNFKRPSPAVGQPSNGMPQDDQMKPNISNSNKKSDDPGDEKPSCEIPKETPPFRQVIFCSIERVDVEKDI